MRTVVPGRRNKRLSSEGEKKGEPIRRCIIDSAIAACFWLLNSAVLSKKPWEKHFKIVHLGGKKGKHASLSS